MNTYIWNIKLMDTIPQLDGYQDFVTRIYWDYHGFNPYGITSFIEGYTEWNQVNEVNFIPYGDITLNDVINWLEDYNDITNLQLIINKKIEDIIYPPIINLPFPWEPFPTTTTTTELPPIEETTTTEQV